jgi:RHS repeat-associated protein
MDFDGSGTLTERYLTNPKALSQFYGQVNASGVPQWFLTDNINSIRQVISTSGTSLDAITYDPYGNIVNQTNAANAPRLLFTGGAYDSLTGTYLDGAREDKPSNGRWLSEDPSGLGPDTNPYRDVGNDPANAIDPSGLHSVTDPARLKEIDRQLADYYGRLRIIEQNVNSGRFTFSVSKTGEIQTNDRRMLEDLIKASVAISSLLLERSQIGGGGSESTDRAQKLNASLTGAFWRQLAAAQLASIKARAMLDAIDPAQLGQGPSAQEMERRVRESERLRSEAWLRWSRGSSAYIFLGPTGHTVTTPNGGTVPTGLIWWFLALGGNAPASGPIAPTPPPPSIYPKGR